MKRIILFSAFLLATTFAKSQPIDSVSVWLTTVSYDSEPWEYSYMYIDSFSTGFRINSLGKKWMNNAWVNDYLWNYSYSAGLLIEKDYQIFDSTQWLNKVRWLYTYSSTKDSTYIQAWNQQWVDSLLNIQIKNSIGLDSILIVSQWVNSNWVNYGKTETTYFSDSSEATILSYVWNHLSNQWDNNLNVIHNQDSLNRDTAIVQIIYRNANWENYKIEFIYYDSLGNDSANIYASWDPANNDWIDIYFHEEMNYDSLNRLINSYGGAIPGGSSQSTWQYDSAGINFIQTLLINATNGDQTFYDYHLFYFTLANPTLNLFLPNDYSICPSDSIPIGAFIIGPNQPLNYMWTPSSDLSSDTIENPYVTTDTAVTYILTVTDTSNNIYTDTISIGIKPPLSISILNRGAASCLSCNNGYFVIQTTGGNLSIEPDLPSVYLHGDTIKGLTPGIYTVCTENNWSCMACVTDTVFDGALGIQDISGFDYSIRPNPATEYFELQFENPENDLHFSLVDISGRVIIDQPISGKQERIDSKGLKSGLYFGILSSPHSLTRTFKIILQ